MKPLFTLIFKKFTIKNIYKLLMKIFLGFFEGDHMKVKIEAICVVLKNNIKI